MVRTERLRHFLLISTLTAIAGMGLGCEPVPTGSTSDVVVALPDGGGGGGGVDIIACTAIGCPPGLTLVDTDGDGCGDTCLAAGACAGNAECGGGDYCSRPAGACSGPGKCAPRPDACTEQYQPVCGCDQQTYSNACFAAAAGVGVAHAGECPAAGPCGGLIGASCPAGMVCDLPPGLCAGADLQGVCVPKPEICTDDWTPVCGCDGKTYSNECGRLAAGVQKAHNGSCECPKPPPCPDGSLAVDTTGDGCPDACPAPGCKSNDQCKPGLYCQKAGCGDGLGTCAPRPEACPTIWTPVCGCDQKTYGNHCEAAAAGVNVASAGECAGTQCDGFAGIPCPAGQFCEHPAGECSVADGAGKCLSIADNCDAVWKPVCGCDQKTYGSDCERRLAGVQKDHVGPCECPPLACPSGAPPVDTDGDGCPDTCQAGGCKSNLDCSKSEYCAKVSCDAPSGVCAWRPEACIQLYDPVCGCDGKTHGNACSAASAGVNVAHPGACGVCKPLECAPGTQAVDTDGDGCKDTCQGTCADACDCYLNPALSFETPCPLMCPMCGNYWTCEAGLCQEQCGAMPPGTGDCKGQCKSNEDCPAGEYCNRKGCGLAGQCAPVPDVCPFVWAPVCTCDGLTLGNACTAAAQGKSVAHLGECTCPALACPPGTDGVDTTGDGCPDTCKAPCNTACDCYQSGQVFQEQCAAACITCDEYWTCEAGYCAELCGPVPPEIKKCTDCWAVIDCLPGYMPVDQDGDGCPDGCAPSACKTNDECGGSTLTYCAHKAGACSDAGLCQVRPTACPDVWKPVCGCDGKTYGNECEAAAAGASVSHDGACTSGGGCGGFVGKPCPAGQWCDPLAGACNGADLPGLCVAVPDACIEIYKPVCGCDGKTYGNDCLRQAATVAKDHDGPCVCLIAIDCFPGFYPVDSDGDGCDDTCKPSKCATSADCGGTDLTYCAHEAGACQGTGLCAVRPSGCTKEYAPVCGCDGTTYGNACMAASAGVSVAAKGECAVTVTCGGFIGTACPAGSFCELPAGLCNAADLGGKCVPVPLGCPDNWLPVCGCNGTTYSNDCDRQVAGVQLSHTGACECAVAIKCAQGFTAMDTDGDGCPDTCVPAACKSNAECGGTAQTWCATDPGQCGAGGVCATKPQACILIYDPVCGCNGATYGSACLAASAGVGVAFAGPCDATQPQ